MPNFDKLLSSGLWERAVYVVIGFMAPGIIQSQLSGQDFASNLPNEAYGLGTIVLMEFVGSGQMKTYTQAGAAGRVVQQVLRNRAGVDI